MKLPNDKTAVAVILANIYIYYYRAVVVTTLLFAVLRADHCRTPLAPLRGVPWYVRYDNVPFDTVTYGTLLYCTVPYRRAFVLLCKIQYGTVQYRTEHIQRTVRAYEYATFCSVLSAHIFTEIIVSHFRINIIRLLNY